MSHDKSTEVAVTFDTLPDSAFIRLAQMLPNKGNQAPIIPLSPSTFWRRVKDGKFPTPVKLSSRVTAWRVGDVRVWLRNQGGAL